LLDIETIKKYDSNEMYRVYDNWPKIAEDSFNSVLEPIDLKNISHVVFAGMGGSGALGDVFSSIVSKTNVHVDVVKGYRLPNTVNSETLVVATSISGNTVETLNVLKMAQKIHCKIIAFSSNGAIDKICKEKSIEHRNILMNHSPRASFTAFLFGMLKTLYPILPISKEDIFESISILKENQSKFSTENLSETNDAIDIAEWIQGIPILYYPWGLKSAVTRFKNSLQENSKCHVIVENVIEACHNGIVAWEKSANVQPILIEGVDDFEKTKERWTILKSYFNDKNVEYKEVISVQGSILSKLINLIYLFDYISIYKAVLSEIDPSPVKSIDFIKKQLR